MSNTPLPTWVWQPYIRQMLFVACIAYWLGHACHRAPAPTAAPGAEIASDDLKALRAESQALQGRIRAREEALYGTPVAWPEETPPDWQPAAFEARMRRAVAECDLPLDAVRVDCAEPPCVLIGQTPDVIPMLTDPSYAQLTTCPAWTEVFSTPLGTANAAVPCRGAAGGFVVVAPRPDWLYPAEDRAAWERLSQRFPLRLKKLREDWDCGQTSPR